MGPLRPGLCVFIAAWLDWGSGQKRLAFQSLGCCSCLASLWSPVFLVWLFCFCCLVMLCSSCGTSVVFLWLLTWFCGSCYVAPVGLHASSVFLRLLGVPSAALLWLGSSLALCQGHFVQFSFGSGSVLVWLFVVSSLALVRRWLGPLFGRCVGLLWVRLAFI